MIEDLVEVLEACKTKLNSVVTRDAPPPSILTSCQNLDEILESMIVSMKAQCLRDPARREECKVQGAALIFDGLVYMHPALRQYNGTWVVVEQGEDRLIVSDGLGKTICEPEVYE